MRPTSSRSGPGSLFTSVIPNLLVEGISPAIQRSRALKAYFVNLMWQPGETIGFRASDHVDAIHRHAGMQLIDVAVVNTRAISARQRRKYAAENVRSVLNDVDRLAEMGLQVVATDLLGSGDSRSPRSARLRRGCTTIGKARTSGTRQDPRPRSSASPTRARMKSQINVVILAAGLGTRMKSKRAKVLHRAGGLSLIEHVVQASSAIAPAGTPPSSSVIKANKFASCSRLRASVLSSKRSKKAPGMPCWPAANRWLPSPASSWCCMAIARCWLPRPFANWSTGRLPATSAATLITTRLDDPTGYGRIIFGEAPATFRPSSNTRTRRPEQLAIPFINSGIYCFRADLLWRHLLEIRPDNPAHEYYLTDIVEILNRAGHSVAAMEVDNPAELLGINTRVELAEVDRIFRERKVRELMLAGVTIEKPETVTIDAACPNWRGFRRGTVRANPRQHRHRRRIPHRRLLHRSGFQARRWSRDCPIHSHRGFCNRNRRAHRTLRAAARQSAGWGRTPASEISWS